jgi:ABC-2 type transport system ATP-binding protein
MADALRTTGLVKTFGKVRALDGLDLAVEHGEVHGFLGPNGAGKSTTIRVLLGLIKATAGEVQLLGGDPWRQATELHRRVAYVPGDVTLWPNLSGGETLDLLSRLRGGVDAARCDALVERFGLDLTKKGRDYSKGNRQKVALVAAFAADAELLILDEPTSGLDPLKEEQFRQCVREVKARGTTVLLSSHILSEVEALCDRVSIVRDGKTVETGTLSELRHIRRSEVSAVLADGAALSLDGVAGVHGLVVDRPHVRFQVDDAALSDVLGRVAAAGVVSLTCEPPSLEELFLEHYGAPSDAGSGATGASAAAGASSAPRT